MNPQRKSSSTKRARLGSHATRYALDILTVQLAVYIAALPLFAVWGFPISMVGLVSSVMLAPLFALLITLFTVFFFAILIGIPLGPLASMIEQSHNLLGSILQLGSKNWLWFFAQPPFFIACAIPCAGWWCLQSGTSASNRLYKLALVAAISTLVLITYSWMHHAGPLIYQSKKYQMIAKKTPYGIEIHDNGFLSHQHSPLSFIRYQLQPQLIRAFGNGTIASLTTKNISPRVQECIQELEHTFTIKHIYTRTGSVARDRAASRRKKQTSLNVAKQPAVL